MESDPKSADEAAHVHVTHATEAEPLPEGSRRPAIDPDGAHFGFDGTGCAPFGQGVFLDIAVIPSAS